MSRTALQFVVGLALGFVTVYAFHPPVGESSNPIPVNVVAAAAATMIAPRLWWTGIIALWLGQAVARAAVGVEWTAAIISDSAPQFLVGAVLGGALWCAVDWQRKRAAALRDEACEL